MPVRVGVLKVTNDGAMIRAEASGQLTPQEWIFALEIAKARILSQVTKGASPQDVARMIARPLEVPMHA